MKYSNLVIISLFCLIYSETYAQDFDSTSYIEPFYDLKMTPAQRDSMRSNLHNMASNIQRMHTFSLTNDIAPALVFDPLAIAGFTSEEQDAVNWDIPQDVSMPENRNELAYYSIEKLASLIKSHRITSVELTEFFIDRFKNYGDTLECVVSLLEESAMVQAKAADQALKAGEYKGPLHGIPYGLKDLFAVEGTITSWGAMPYKDQEITKTATIVQKLEEAGAVLIAKLTLGALAMGDVWYGGVTRNPWNLKQGSSGSSAGSASAVSAGLVPFAIGTETLGSIVSPSTRCGATGLRPTFGRVSRSGGMALSWSMDKVGPIARGAKDAAIVFDAIRGKDPEDPTTRASAFNYSPDTPVTSLRVGYIAGAFEGRKQDSITLEEIRKLGVVLEAVELSDDFPVRAMTIILASEASAAFDELTRSGKDSLMVRQDQGAWPNYFRSSRFIPAAEYVNANRIRSQLILSFNKAFEDFDVIIAPSFSNQLYTTNLTGHPCLVVPNGFSANGSPTSITFLAGYMDEASLITIGEAFQEATDYDDKHPEMFMD